MKIKLAKIFVLILVLALFIDIGLVVSRYGFTDRAMRAIPAQALSSVALASVLIFILYLFVTYVAKGKSKPDKELTQAGEIFIHGNVQEVSSKVVSALQRVERLKGVEVSDEGLRIFAKSKISWQSFGENILIILDEEGDGEVKVSITSAPRVSTTMHDFGSNAENIQLIVNALEGDSISGEKESCR